MKNTLSKKFSIYPPYNLIYLLDNGAIQEIKGTTVNGYWQIKDVNFFFSFPIEEEKIVKTISETLVAAVDWNKILKKIEDNDYEKMPSRTDIDNMDLIEFLLSLGVLRAQVNPNVIVNGQPQTDLIIDDDYKIVYEDKEALSVIDITDSANPRSEK